MRSIVTLGTAATLALAMAAPAFAGDTLDRVMSTKTLTMSSDAEYPPQSFLNEPTRWTASTSTSARRSPSAWASS